MGLSKKWTKEQRERVKTLRDGGMVWRKIIEATGIPKSTCILIYKEESLIVPEDEVFLKPRGIVEAYVLKHVPNPRLMLIAFPDNENIARCVKRPEDNRPPKTKLFVKQVDDDLFRIV